MHSTTGSISKEPIQPSQDLGQPEVSPTTGRTDERKADEVARILGQPEGPFGTTIVAHLPVLIRSLGAERFSKFTTLEIAQHGFFVSCSEPKNYPFQAKSTLLEIHFFLGEPAHSGSRIIKSIGRIEEIRAAVDLPVPLPPGFIIRFLQISPDDAASLEKYIHERLLHTAV
jgi:hypothetical protein